MIKFFFAAGNRYNQEVSGQDEETYWKISHATQVRQYNLICNKDK